MINSLNDGTTVFLNAAYNHNSPNICQDAEIIKSWAGLRPGRSVLRLEKEDLHTNKGPIKVNHEQEIVYLSACLPDLLHPWLLIC